MDELFGIPLALDIGTFAGLLVAGFTAAGATTWLRKVWKNEKQKEVERVQVEKLAEEERAETYRMHKEALEIHGSLTSLEVFQAAQGSEISPAQTSFLIATYRRGSSRYEAFKDTVELDENLEGLVTSSLEGIAALFPKELRSEQAKVEEKRIRRTRGGDRSKFKVGDFGSHSKHHTLHAIEKRFCETNEITSRDDFEGRFGALVVELIGAELGTSRFDAKKLLKDPAAVTAKAKERYGPRDQKLISTLGPITLDGVDYIADFDAGFAPQPADIGRRVHLPLIEKLIVKLGYDDIAAAS